MFINHEKKHTNATKIAYTLNITYAHVVKIINYLLSEKLITKNIVGREMELEIKERGRIIANKLEEIQSLLWKN